jgi:hypothetical protein
LKDGRGQISVTAETSTQSAGHMAPLQADVYEIGSKPACRKVSYTPVRSDREIQVLSDNKFCETTGAQ